jgi:hypothetical protein
MPQENTVKTDAVVDPAENNAKVAAQLKAQDISGQSTATGEFGEATDALDKLASQVKPPEVTPKPDAAPDPKPDATPAPKPDATPAPKADAPAAPDPALLKRAEELFKDSPTLPPNASPKSSEAFSSIKLKSAQEISAREQQIEALKKQLEEAKSPSTEQLTKEKELEELRQWRAKLDVDYDPKFKEHDKGIEQSREFIYAQLAKNPAVTPEIIEQIKKYGGPDNINLVKLFESIKDPTLQRLVEAKVADIEMAKYNREQAVKSAKENVGQYLKERQEASTKAEVAKVQAVTANLTANLDKLEWLKTRDTAGVTDDNQKKEIEAHNKFVTELNEQIAVAVKDDSPEMRAVLITGMAQLFNLQRRVPSLEATLVAKDQALKDITAKWEAIKGASRSRLNESAAPAAGIPGSQKPNDNINVAPGDALDAIARQVMEKRAAAGSGQ